MIAGFDAPRDRLRPCAGHGGLVDATIAGQAEREIETLEEVTGRTLPAPERRTLHETLHGSLDAIMTGVGLTHPSFAKVAHELSPEGSAKLGIA